MFLTKSCYILITVSVVDVTIVVSIVMNKFLPFSTFLVTRKPQDGNNQEQLLLRYGLNCFCFHQLLLNNLMNTIKKVYFIEINLICILDLMFLRNTKF